MATNSSENTTDEQLVALNETPQPRDPYCFVDPDEEFEFQSSSSSLEDFKGFTRLDCRHARRQLLFRRPSVEVSASSSDDEEGDFSGYTREEIFFPEGSNSREFCENRGVSTSSSNHSDDSASDPGLKGSRKRKKNPKRWQRNVRKRARAEGTRYKMTSGRIKSPRKQGPPCSCPKKCFEQVSKEEREHLIMQFNHMGTHELQNQYLRGLIVASNVKRRGAGGKLGSAKDKPGKRSTSFEYFVVTSINRRVKVCRQAFLSIHGIGYTRVKNLRQSAVCKPDMRGKHGNRPKKVTNIHLQNVRNHIKSFPRVASHYSRNSNNKKRYLKEGLSVHRMYQLYLEKFEPAIVVHEREVHRARQEQRRPPQPLRPKVSYRKYLELFNTEFNLGFGRPRSDTCAQCEKLNLILTNTEDEAERQKAQEDLKAHQTKADNGYKSKSADRERSRQSWEGKRRVVSDDITFNSKDAIDMITFDLQQNLPTPNLNHNDIFYLRQLWTYNFGIHDCVTEQGYMFMWHEALAKRGASEISSCLNTFFNRFRTGARSLVSYSDSCGGQNKNLTILGMLSDLHLANVYQSIDHIYLERGHTYLENDRDFGIIEKRKQSAEVYIPSQWYQVVREASLKKPFQVVEMQQEDFLDFKGAVAQRYALQNKDRDGNRVLLREIHWLNFGWGAEMDREGRKIMVHHPYEVWMRRSFSSEEPWIKVRLIKRESSENNIIASPPAQLYHSQIPLKPGKLKDLKKIASQHVIPNYRGFYLCLRGEGEESDDDTEYSGSDCSASN